MSEKAVAIFVAGEDMSMGTPSQPSIGLDAGESKLEQNSLFCETTG